MIFVSSVVQFFLDWFVLVSLVFILLFIFNFYCVLPVRFYNNNDDDDDDNDNNDDDNNNNKIQLNTPNYARMFECKCIVL